MISTLKLVNPFLFCCFRFSFKTPREALLIYLLHTDIMLFQWTCLKLQQSGENLPRKLPPNQPRPCILFCSLQIFHNSGSESFIEVCQWSPTVNKSFPTCYSGNQFDSINWWQLLTLAFFRCATLTWLFYSTVNCIRGFYSE